MQSPARSGDAMMPGRHLEKPVWHERQMGHGKDHFVRNYRCDNRESPREKDVRDILHSLLVVLLASAREVSWT